LRPAWTASQVQPVEALRRDGAAGAQVGALKKGPVIAAVALVALAYACTLLPPPVENLPIGGFLAIFLTLMGVTMLSPVLLRALQPVFQRPGQWLLGVSGRLAADNFARAPGRTAVPVSALAIGVAMTVCIVGFVGSFRVSAMRWIDQSVPADLFVTSSSKIAGVTNTPMIPSLGHELEKLDGVDSVDFVRLYQHEVLDLMGYLISWRPEVYYQHAQPTVLEGSLPTAEERRRAVVAISENLSRRRDLHPGDTFPLNTPAGVKTLSVGAVVIDYTTDQGTVFLERDDFVAWFHDDRVDTFEVYVKPGANLESVRRQITERFGTQHDLYVLSNHELRVEALNLVEAAFAVTYAMEAVAVLLALLGVINTLLAAVLDRTREIGLLRAVGAARGHILRLFVGEAAFIGISGGLIGAALGGVMGVIITYVVGVQATGWLFPFVYPTGVAIQMVVAASVCAVIAGLYPARRAAGLNVVEALAWE
ncbi:MAG: ABC transporter permease, partial [Myxococcaceae bacterium]